jgi:single-stranded-DNA-specific exonuclease
MSLIGVAGLTTSKINATDIGYVLGPRLNAAGRLESAYAALYLLLTDDVGVAASLAQQLDNQNRLRQRQTREIQAIAEKLAFEKDPDPLLLFAVDENFSSGIVGLAASRLTEQYYRPAIVAHKDSNYTRGSCRSIKEFHITKALDQCADLLEHHGGHAAAAGFTVRNSNLPELEDRLHKIAEEQLSSLDLRPTISADLELPLSDLTSKLLNCLEWLQPTGYGNPIPTFNCRALQVKNSRTVGADNAHLKLVVSDGWITFDAIAFRQGYWQGQLPPKIDVMFHFELNEYSGRQSFQLNIQDIRPSNAC